MIEKDLAVLLKAERIRAGMSITELAEKMGVSRMVIHRIEAGDHHYSTTQLNKMSKVLKFNLEWVVKREI